MQVEPYYEFLRVLKSRQYSEQKKKIKIWKTLIRPVATHGAESSRVSKDIAKRMANFERKVLRRNFGGN
jgi:hypothetical protein